MQRLEALRQELSAEAEVADIRPLLLCRGYEAHLDDPIPLARAHAAAALFTGHAKHIYPHDRILGSLRGALGKASPARLAWARELADSYGRNTFWTNCDHYAPDYPTFLAQGIPGTLARIADARIVHAGDPGRLQNLEAMELTLRGFREMILGYAQAARNAAGGDPELLAAADACQAVADAPPATFRESLQLAWLCHTAFLYEGRYAMALGRMDQYLYPYYAADRAAGRITPEEAQDLLACTLLKIGEYRLLGGDDVVNIAIAGCTRQGDPALNPLSYAILRAVRDCNIPGPNLSARLYPGVDEGFLDECLQVIGTGLGYPALMNDAVNIPALAAKGYPLEDARDYAMVGCIENFIPGKQPPWSDGRYNTPKYLELALNGGVCMLTGVPMGPPTPPAEEMASMEDFMAALKRQMRHGASLYMARFRNENDRYRRENYTQPFLSLFCQDCIGRGLDIREGGALYPSVHGAGCMGIATVADSLAAIHRVVFQEGRCTLAQLRDALAADFQGREPLQAALLRAPKYGNGDPFVDQYAQWFVDFQAELFDGYRTPDGGRVYIAIASNVQNIPAGREVAATPDGRRARAPLSDAASPMHGMDRQGPTAVIRSVTRPDYTKVACGTVVNQKYSPEMFSRPEKRALLRSMIQVYLAQGGQEIQINAVSRELLRDAMDHPEAYGSLVVRVSGFSAYYTTLDRTVQEDILQRTQHG